MSHSRGRSGRPEPVDLNPTFEALVARIGTRIGRRVALALTEGSLRDARGERLKPLCANPSCEREVVAKGLCKSHYNLMLYHRRKAQAGGRRSRRGKSKG